MNPKSVEGVKVLLKVKGIKLDRLTVVGKMKRFKREMGMGKGKSVTYLDSKVMKMLRQEEDWRGMRFDFARESIWLKMKGDVDKDSRNPYDYWYRIGGHIFIQIISKESKGNDIRIDWNPSKLEDDESWFLFELLRNITDKRFTRIDLALDIEGNLAKGGWEVLDEKKRKRHYYEKQFTGELETCNLGTHYSCVEVTIYDKAVEENRKLLASLRGMDKDIKEDVKEEMKSSNWWRIEEKIRGDAVRDWRAHIWFDGVKLVKGRKRKDVDKIIFPDELKHSWKCYIVACMYHPELIEGFSKATKSKLRKYLDEIVWDDAIEEFEPRKWIEENGHEMIEIRKFLDGIIGEETKDRWVKKDGKETEEEWEKTKELFESWERLYEKYKKPSFGDEGL